MSDPGLEGTGRAERIDIPAIKNGKWCLKDEEEQRARVLRETSHTYKMQLETKTRASEQAVNKQHPFSDEKGTAGPSVPQSVLTWQTDFALTFPRNDKGNKTPQNNLIPAAAVLI